MCLQSDGPLLTSVQQQLRLDFECADGNCDTMSDIVNNMHAEIVVISEYFDSDYRPNNGEAITLQKESEYKYYFDAKTEI